jgi:protein phosphatase
MIDVIAAGLSETGPYRLNNEDCIGSHVPSDELLRERKGLLYVLADGVGGQLAGEVASATAVGTIIEEYFAPSNHARIEPALRQAVQTANLRIFNQAQANPEQRNMATTVSALALAGGHAYIAHVGDSRIYHWRNGVLTQLTQDHSEVAELIRMRVVSKDRARDHPHRNVLTRVVGAKLILRPDFSRHPIMPDDLFLQCTDGLWAELADEDIATILGDCDPETACRTLVAEAIARDGQDNVSVQVVKVVATGPDPHPDSTRSRWISGLMQRMGI